MAECELCIGTNEVKLDATTYGSRVVSCPKCVHRILVGKLVEAGRANAKLREALLEAAEKYDFDFGPDTTRGKRWRTLANKSETKTKDG